MLDLNYTLFLTKSMNIRKILHIDMDAYYASIEQRDNPELKGKPVVVGGLPDERAVVCSASYEARKFGIKSGMSTKNAYKLCKNAIFLQPRFDAYIATSKIILNLFYEYTDIVEPVSLDEAYLDVTENKKNIIYAVDIAKEIKRKIFEITSLTASAGVSYNKFLAKIASDYKKPDGLTVITPENAQKFIDNLPVGKFYGIGKVTEKKLLSMGIKNGADLKKLSLPKLIEIFGKSGKYYYDIVRGIDESPVETDYERKSIGKEITLPDDTLNINTLHRIIEELAVEIENWLKENSAKGRTITLKIKYFDFKLITRSITLKEPIFQSFIIIKYAKELLLKTLAGKKKIRLVGLSISNLEKKDEDDPQLKLF